MSELKGQLSMYDVMAENATYSANEGRTDSVTAGGGRKMTAIDWSIRDLQEPFKRALKAETQLSPRERNSLLNMYWALYCAVKVELSQEAVNEEETLLRGAINFLIGCGKILDDEPAMELVKEIKAGEIK